MDPKDPIPRELAPSGADQVLSTGTRHPAHVAVIDISQAQAPLVNYHLKEFELL